MTRIIRSLHHHYVRPFGQAFVTSASLNHRLWTRDFGVAWETLRLDEKLIWLAFIMNTICIFTLIEFLFIR